MVSDRLLGSAHIWYGSAASERVRVTSFDDRATICVRSSHVEPFVEYCGWYSSPVPGLENERQALTASVRSLPGVTLNVYRWSTSTPDEMTSRTVSTTPSEACKLAIDPVRVPATVLSEIG